MKKTFILVIFTIIFLSLHLRAFAENDYVAYFGSDLDQASANSYSKMLNASSYKFFSLNDATVEFKEGVAGEAKDGIKISLSNAFSLRLIKNSDNKIDSLGYSSMLLALGVYNGNISVINNNTLLSLLQTVKTYQDAGGIYDTGRYADFKDLFGIYYDLQKEIGTEKASKVIYDIEYLSSADPDYNYPTNTIVKIALKQNNSSISSSLLNRLYNWTKNYVYDGNKWTGFFRQMNEYSKSDIVNISYRQLDSAPSQNDSNATSKKAAALVIFIVFLVILLYFVYKSRGRENNIR